MAELDKRESNLSQKEAFKLDIKNKIEDGLTQEEAKDLADTYVEDLKDIHSEVRKGWKELDENIRKAFQKEIGTKEDGLMGPKTIGKLLEKGGVKAKLGEKFEGGEGEGFVVIKVSDKIKIVGLSDRVCVLSDGELVGIWFKELGMLFPEKDKLEELKEAVVEWDKYKLKIKKGEVILSEKAKKFLGSEDYIEDQGFKKTSKNPTSPHENKGSRKTSANTEEAVINGSALEFSSEGFVLKNGEKFTGKIDEEKPFEFRLNGHTGKYSGDVKEGLYHGQGKFVYSNGTVYIGGFERGQCQGEGFKLGIDGKMIERGMYNRGVLDKTDWVYNKTKKVWESPDGKSFGK